MILLLLHGNVKALPGKHIRYKLYVSDPSFVILGTAEELILGVF
jgi:hypothetical protein